MMFMFVTKIIVKIGSIVYKNPTFVSSFHRGSGLTPMSTSKNLPENMGMERVQEVHPMRAKTEAASFNLCCIRRLHKRPQLIGIEDSAEDEEGEPGSFESSSSMSPRLGSEAGAEM